MTVSTPKPVCLGEYWSICKRISFLDFQVLHPAVLLGIYANEPILLSIVNRCLPADPNI
jgi:hypothetical protein